MTVVAALERVLGGNDLDAEMMGSAMQEVMEGRAPPAQLAGWLVALRMKGETAGELAAAAAVMRRHAAFIDAGARCVVDTCGTGGDGGGTFNISTAAALIAAGAGVCVAKHGNRAVSSRCGSADVLAALGVRIEADPEVMEECLQEHGIAFLFAPKMHPAMRHAAGVRRELGVRTLFNMLGPLTNPAGATGQVLGVFDPALTEMFALALRDLGARRAFVVHGMDGLDEITVTGPTRVSALRDGEVKTYEFSADRLLGEVHPPEALAGGDPERNAAILCAVLDGQPGGPRDAALINAAAAIVAGEKADTLEEGLRLAREAVDSAAAAAKLEALKKASQA